MTGPTRLSLPQIEARALCIVRGRLTVLPLEVGWNRILPTASARSHMRRTMA
jgi:hypothetical protein